MARTRRRYPRRYQNQYYGYGYGPSPRMMNQMANTTMGIIGFGMMTSMGIGMINAMKPN